MMNCEEFELRGLDLDRADADPQEAAAATKHAAVCGRCGAMLLSPCQIAGAEAGKQGDARDEIAAHFVAPCAGQSPAASTQKA